MSDSSKEDQSSAWTRQQQPGASPRCKGGAFKFTSPPRGEQRCTPALKILPNTVKRINKILFSTLQPGPGPGVDSSLSIQTEKPSAIKRPETQKERKTNSGLVALGFSRFKRKQQLCFV